MCSTCAETTTPCTYKHKHATGWAILMKWKYLPEEVMQEYTSLRMMQLMRG